MDRETDFLSSAGHSRSSGSPLSSIKQIISIYQLRNTGETQEERCDLMLEASLRYDKDMPACCSWPPAAALADGRS